MRWFDNIIYVAEASVAQESAFERAVSLTKNNQAKLTVIEVLPEMPKDLSLVHDLQKAALDERRSALEAMVAPYRGQFDIQIDILTGKRFLEIVRTVLRNKHDLLIKPAENPAYTQRLFGSDDMQLLRNCPCPVWLMRAGENPQYRTILAAVDFDLNTPDSSDAGLSKHIATVSSSLAISDFAALHFLHAWDAPGEGLVSTWTSAAESTAYVDGTRAVHEKAFNALREQLRERIGGEAFAHLDPQFHLRRGAATTTIAAAVKEVQADLLVMGTVARTGIAGWLVGNTAEAVLEQVQCSVLAVKPRGFVSPVEARARPGG